MQTLPTLNYTVELMDKEYTIIAHGPVHDSFMEGTDRIVLLASEDKQFIVANESLYKGHVAYTDKTNFGPHKQAAYLNFVQQLLNKVQMPLG